MFSVFPLYFFTYQNIKSNTAYNANYFMLLSAKLRKTVTDVPSTSHIMSSQSPYNTTPTGYYA